jgi:hypothetical protein
VLHLEDQIADRRATHRAGAHARARLRLKCLPTRPTKALVSTRGHDGGGERIEAHHTVRLRFFHRHGHLRACVCA